MKKRILIVGGGTGGTLLANTLDKKRFDVTLVSASAEHMFQPGLLYIAFRNASHHVMRKERSLLKKHVTFVQDTVTRVDLRERVAETGGGMKLEYDSIVIGTGTRTDTSQIPGLDEINARFGDYHSSVAQAQKLWKALDSFEGGTIVLGQASPICKCPPSPVEGILLTEELVRKKGLRDKTRLVFFTPYPRAYPAAPMNEIIEPILKERGIEIMTFFDLDRIDTQAKTLTSIEGDTVSYDMALVVPPFTGAPIAFEPADVIDENGFIKTEKTTLHVHGFDDAFAIGDATNLPTSKSGVGAHLEAQTVVRTLEGKPRPFNGRTHCPVDLAYGRGTFVIGSYTAPVVKLRPSRIRHWMKMTMAYIYWLSLRGMLNWMFDLYFGFTSPDRLAPHPEPHPAK